MADPTFRAILTVLDKATAPLRAIAKSVHGLHGVAEKAGEGLGRVGEKLGDLLKPLALLGSGLSAAGLVEFAKHAAEYGAQIYDAGLKTGISAEQLSAWHYAAKLSGVEAEGFDKSMVKLNRTLAEAAAGKNQEARALFHHLGIDLLDAKKHIRGAADVLPQLAKAFALNENPALRTRMAMLLMGRAGAEMLPLLVRGDAFLEEMAGKARFLGLTLTGDAAKGAKEFEDSWRDLEGATQGLANTVGTKLFPVLRPLIGQLTYWIAANRDLIATGVEKAVKALADAVRSVDWAAVVHDLAALARGFGAVLEFLGPTGVALAALAVYIGPLVLALISAGASLASFALALGLTPLGWALGAVIALTAAIVGLYEAYKHWDEIKQSLGETSRMLTSVPQPGDETDPMSGMVVARGPKPLYGAGGAPGTPGANGQVEVRISLEDMPRGTRVAASSSGPGVAPPQVDVGYGLAGMAGAF
jgi:hypothetical protein